MGGVHFLPGGLRRPGWRRRTAGTVRLGMAGAIDDARKIKDAIEHDNVELVRRLLNHTNCELMERCRSA